MNNYYDEPNNEQKNEPVSGSNPYGEPVQNPYVNKHTDEYSYEEISPAGQPYMNDGYTTPVSETVYTQATPQKTGLAVAALVLGIIALVTSCFGFNIIIGIVGIIFAAVYLAKKQSARRGMAIAGLVLSIISIAVFVILVILLVVFALSGTYAMFMSDPLYQEMYNDILMEMY